MLESAKRSSLGGPVRVVVLVGMCSLLLLANSVANGQIPQRRVRRPAPNEPVSRIGDKDLPREYELKTEQPLNSIQVQVRYRTDLGYKYDSGVFGGSGPTSCDAFFISAGPDPAVRQENLYGIHKTDKMRKSSGFYVCDFLVTDLPLNAPIKVGVDLADHRTSPFEPWKGGIAAQPPPGQERTIIIVGGTGTLTLSDAEPRATMLFEMVYAPPTRRRVKALAN
jgi:hypothetical protein